MKPSTSDTATPPKTAEKRKWFSVRIRHRWLILIGGFILLAVGFRVLLPTLVERGAAYGSRYYLGLPARIDNVDFSLFKGVVVFEGVSVGASPDAVTPINAAFHPPAIDPASALLHFDRISFHLSWRDLFKKTLHLTEVTIEAPALRVVREGDGLIDPLRHAKPLASPSKSTANSSKPASEPWAMEVNQFALRSPNVVITDPSSQQNLLEFSLERFELDNVSAKAGDFSLGAIGIHGPILRVRRDLVMTKSPAGEKAAVSQSVAPAAATAGNQTGPTASSAAGYRIKKIDIERAKFTWVTEEGPLDVMLTLKASNITAEQGKGFPIDLALQIADGSVNLSGNVGLLPPTYTGRFRWSGLPFPPLLLASLPKLAAWLRSAESSGDLKIDADIAGAHGRPSLRFSGRSTIEALAIADPGDKEFSLGWKQLETVMNDVVVPIPEAGKALPTTRADFAIVRLVEPKILYTHPSPALNALLGISSSPATDSSTSAASATPLDVTITSLELAGGDVEIHDTTVKPTATSTVHDLSVTARDVHFPDPSATVIAIRATLPVASLLTIDGSLQPGNVGGFAISLQKLDLPTFNSYAIASGVSLDAGQASVQMKLKTQGVLMQIDNDLVLQKFGVSLRDPSSFNREFGMPIDLVIALMSDPAGDIRLKIPIKVDEKGTSVSKHDVIASALKAALLGAVSTPLKLLGAAFGKSSGPAAGPLAIAPIKCLPGSADFAPDAPARMDGLVKLLAQRPTMGLVLRGRTSADDQPLVAEQLLIERIKAGQGLPEVRDAGFLARHRMTQILSKRGKGEKVPLSPKDQALFERYLAAAGSLEDRLTALAKSRAEKARDMLVTKGVSAKRLTIGDREAPGEAGVAIAFRPQQAVPAKSQ